MRSKLVACLVLGGSLTLFGCVGAPLPEVVAAAPAVPGKPVISGQALSLGKSLTDEERQAAFDAQVAALEKGQRQTWKGKHGAFGYVEPGAESARADGVCRDYVHKIYVAGRPQSGNGSACRDASGAWRFVS